MNSQTYRLFKMAVEQLQRENYNVQSDNFPTLVYDRYKSLLQTQEFVSLMLSGKATQKNDKETLATGFRK